LGKECRIDAVRGDFWQWFDPSRGQELRQTESEAYLFGFRRSFGSTRFGGCGRVSAR
jgi:hypothetical protein